MKAVVLAGGFGTRLHPLTVNTPKPMVPMANRPLMAYIIELLARHGLKDIYALLYHQPEIIKNYFKDGRQFGVNLKYIEAPQDFGTAGAVKYACRELKEPILVVSADLLTDIDLSAAIDFHRRKKSAATIVLRRVEDPLQYGIVITDRNYKIKKFLEKPSWSEVFSDTVNAGVYILEPKICEYIPPEKNFDFSQDLFPLLLKERKPIYGFVAVGFWRDIGKIEDYGRANGEILAGKVRVELAGKKLKDKNYWVGENAVISSSAQLQETGMVGSDSIIAERAVLLNTVVGKDCRIGRGAYLRECVIWDGAEIGSEARLERTVVGKSAKVGDRANVEEGGVIGDESEIGKDANIKPFIKIWPKKIIEEGSMVSRSIVWRERWTKSIFGPYGVTGKCNVEITPQFASALGAAYGTMLGKGARISCSRDSHKSSRMIYRALISGVLSTGVNVSNLEMVPIPVNRYELRSFKSQGGFHVRKSPYDPEVIDIKFFDADGMDLSSASEKRIERLFFAESFAQTMMDETGDLSFPFHRVAEEYKAGILNRLDKEAIRSSNLKVVIDYAFGAASQIFPFILGELGLDVISLDAHIDETKITKDKTAFDKSLTQMSKIVRSVDADLGIMLDTGAEKIFLCDDCGNVLDMNQTLGIMTLLILRSAKKSALIAVPINAPRSIEKLAKKYNSKVVRTKASVRAMMETAETGGISFLGESLGGFIFPDFMPAFDGMLSACKLMEWLIKEKVKLCDLEAEVPPSIIVRREVTCSSDQKGKVMRGLIEKVKDADRIETVDGVKLWHDEDWVLVLPDSMRPIIHLFAEADSQKEAEQLTEKYTRLISALKER